MPAAARPSRNWTPWIFTVILSWAILSGLLLGHAGQMAARHGVAGPSARPSRCPF